MTTGGRRRGSAARVVGWPAVLAMLALAAVGPSVGGAAAKDTPGNNGTVKIHEGSSETEPIVRNEPKVCTFHLHFFFGDDEQAGRWQIKVWPPTSSSRAVVLSGTYDTQGDGEDRQPREGVYTLPPGHYKLFWNGDLDTDKHDKQKVFWVECEEASAPPSGGVNPSQGTPSNPPSNPPSNAPSGGTLPSQGTPSHPPSNAPSGGTLPSQGTPSSAPPVGGPSGGVGGATATPLVPVGATLPPTDALAGSEATGGSGWRLILLSLAALLAAVLIVMPQPATDRRR